MSKRTERVEIIHPNAAGLDIGAREIWCCVPPERAEQTVRAFGTFTTDLHQLADWLLACGIDTVAMESTGIYWIPVFEILEVRGMNVYLVNAQHIKHVPGRKSDMQDCQWIQKLHTLGLLTGSFRPDEEMRTLRTYLRHRAQLVLHRAPHISHMQKALQQMNIQLAHVLTDITGDTGLAILRAIIAGERDGVKLAQLRNPHCKSSQETIAKALTGNWRGELLFALQQSLELYDFYTQQIAACDAQIQQQFSVMKPRWVMPSATPVMPSPKRRNKHQEILGAAGQEQLVRLVGLNLAAVDGIGVSLALTILSEIGTDMGRWVRRAN
jgi:transposase